MLKKDRDFYWQFNCIDCKLLVKLFLRSNSKEKIWTVDSAFDRSRTPICDACMEKEKDTPRPKLEENDTQWIRVEYEKHVDGFEAISHVLTHILGKPIYHELGRGSHNAKPLRKSA